MLRGFLTTACRWLQGWSQALSCERMPAPELFSPATARNYRRLRRVVLTDEVSRTLFADFAEHRVGPRGEEEVGWVLLGLREEDEVLVLATLPAGADREAGVAHVHFNSVAQALASRIVRQRDRRLGIVGVVHTHPGSLRHPSDGDLQGDSLWVGRLRGGEGVFGIGTADGKPCNGQVANGKPASGPDHVQAQRELCLSWYALGVGDARYRRLPVTVIAGPDLARPLHSLWGTIETHAETLDGLCRQLAHATFEVASEDRALQVRFPVAESGESLRIVVSNADTQFFLDQGGEVLSIDPQEPQLDRAVFLILAELAGQKRRPERRLQPLGRS
jgi:proteasome lid subunit RPN8/RPN11